MMCCHHLLQVALLVDHTSMICRVNLLELVWIQWFAGNTEHIFTFFHVFKNWIGLYLEKKFFDLIDTSVNNVWLICTLNTTISKIWNPSLKTKTSSVMTAQKCKPVYNENFVQSHQYGTTLWADIHAVCEVYMKYKWILCLVLSSLTCVSLYICKYPSSQNIPNEAILISCINNEIIMNF